MVASIRKLVNTLLSTLFTALQPSLMAQLLSTIDMDINNNIIRGKSASSSKFSSKKSSTHLAASSIPYHERMEIQNNLLSKDFQKPIDSSQLSYTLNNS